MRFRIPFTFAPLDKLKKRSTVFKRYVGYKSKSKLGEYLTNADVPITREEYLSICVGGGVVSLLISFIFVSTILVVLNIQRALIIALGLSLFFSAFLFFIRVSYPKIYHNRKQKEIEKNLIPALEDMLVQLYSGVPLFTILVNISSSDYGELSQQFKRAVRQINAGLPQVEVLEDMGKRNPSEFFRRALWQISNGMRVGSDLTIVIEDTVKSLGEEQFIQIQDYGNKLNPVIMFYMLGAVILPALAITFLTIISSLVNLSSFLTKALFIVLFVIVLTLQIIFLGVIKSVRPSLL